MNILSKLAFWAAQKAAIRSGVTISISENGENSQKLSSMLGGGRSITGKVVNDSTAMQVTTFFACVRLLAETMGTMPSAIYRMEKSGNAEKVDHSLAEVLIHQPNSDMNGLEYREASTTNLAARGNAYSLIERRGDGNVMSLYPVPSSRWQVKRDASTDYEIKYGLNDRGKLEWYPAEKVWHRKGFGFDGLVGLSPIQCARETIGLSLAGEEYNAQLFAQGLMPSAIVSIPQWLKDEQRKVANEKLLEMHTGLKNLGKPMLLEGGMTVTSGLLTPDDAQFLQLRQLTASQICALLNIKPHMVAILEQATNNNIEQLSQEFITYTMMPHMRRDEIAARKLFKPGDRSTYFYRYNADSLMRADSAARAMLYSILLQNGVFNRNEVRALENRNQVADPAMDQYTVQSNMAMLDQLAGLIAARSNSKPTQGAKP
jgi:HK97 family phage portal protein